MALHPRYELAPIAAAIGFHSVCILAITNSSTAYNLLAGQANGNRNMYIGGRDI